MPRVRWEEQLCVSCEFMRICDYSGAQGKSNGEGGGNSDSAELNHDESMGSQTRILRVV
jgi:hypothetical protein